MTILEWALTASLFLFYLVAIVTVCVVTFRKGRYVLGIIGFLFPFLWLLGAILPPRHGSQAWNEEVARHAQDFELEPVAGAAVASE